MDPTNLERPSSDDANSPSTDEESKTPEKAALGDLYKFLTGPYYVLLFVGVAGALAGGKKRRPNFRLVP